MIKSLITRPYSGVCLMNMNKTFVSHLKWRKYSTVTRTQLTLAEVQ